MKHAKILLTAILKDDTEYDMASRMLESFMPYMDGLVVAITGTSGKHKKLLKLLKTYHAHTVVTTPVTHPQIYHNGKFASFAAARNVTFDLADTLSGYDWYSWADVDDVLVGGNQLRFVADTALAKKVDTVLFTYWYAIRVKQDNTFSEDDVQIDHLRERLLKPKMFKWVSRLHEVQVAKDDNYKPTYTGFAYDTKQDQNIAWAHLSNADRYTKNSERNIEILKLQIEEEQYKDPRTIKYLAMSYYDMNDPKLDTECMALFGQYLKLSGWDEERAIAWHYIGNVLARQKDHPKAIKAYLKALEEFPMHHMAYLYLAREYGEIGLLDHSNHWLDVALRMDPPATRTTIGNPLEIKFMAASLLYNKAQRKLDLDESIKWLKVRNEIMQLPDDGMVKTLEDAKLLNEAGTWVFNYSKWLKDTGHTNKIPKLLEALPPELGREAFAHYIANEVKEPKVWDKDTIVYYASWGADHFEPWSPKNMDSGIGGSETAVIELAKRWVKLGYKVTVYGDPRDDEGAYEGVDYRPWYEVNWRDTFNILILWRSPHLLDKDIKTKQLFYDAHDVESQINWNTERMNKISKVFFKTKFHRAMLPKLPDDKAVIISNGINI